jgi:hypothetical protein
MKTCTKCNKEKQLTSFVKNKRQKDSYHYVCKECHLLYKEQNKNTIKDKHKKWLTNNKEYVQLYNKKYNTENKQKKQDSINKWWNNNPNYHKEWKKEKYKTDINFRIKSNLRARFHHAVINQFKIESVIELLGCDIPSFKQYLESKFKPEMNWDNHGDVWEIDHIKPCSSFDLTDIEQQKECFHYINLQPLFKTSGIAEEFNYINEIGNRNKSNKIYEYNK